MGTSLVFSPWGNAWGNVLERPAPGQRRPLVRSRWRQAGCAHSDVADSPPVDFILRVRPEQHVAEPYRPNTVIGRADEVIE